MAQPPQSRQAIESGSSNGLSPTKNGHVRYMMKRMDVERFADDVMASCHDDVSLQDFINRFSTAAQEWGLCVSTDKTKVMIQSSPSNPTNESPVFHIKGNSLDIVSSFRYLGSILSSDSSLSSEINARIAKAASVFNGLKSRVWENSNLSTKTKLAVYNATVLPAMLYGAEAHVSQPDHHLIMFFSAYRYYIFDIHI